jgi:hypothetical protein
MKGEMSALASSAGKETWSHPEDLCWREVGARILDDSLPGMTVLRQHGDTRRGKVVKIEWVGHAPIVAKVWARRDIGGLIRVLSRTSKGCREFRGLQIIRECCPQAPRPILLHRHLHRTLGIVELVTMDHLETCLPASSWLKRLAATDPSAADAFEDAIIDITGRMIDLCIVDPDHKIINFAVDDHGTPFRIDLELCRRVRWPRLQPRLLATMLGSLLSTHVIHTPEWPGRSDRFARRVLERVRPAPSLLRYTQQSVDRDLARFLAKKPGRTGLVLVK